MRLPPLSLFHKALIAVVFVFLPLTVSFIYGYYVNKDHFKKQALEDLVVMVEAYEGQVYQFIEMSKRRVHDFSSDGNIIRLADGVNKGRRSDSELLSRYLIDNKLSLDPSIDRISVISPQGRIIASTNKKYVGTDVSAERFFLDGLYGPSVAEKVNEGMDPEIAVCAPIIGKSSDERVGVIVNFLRLSDINKVLTGEFNKELGAISWSRGRRQTMEAYLVNRDMLMITESRFIDNAILRQKVDTEPVRSCLKDRKELAGFYADYRGIEVAGASMCMPSLGWTLLAEVDSDEILKPAEDIWKGAVAGAVMASGLIVFLFMAFWRFVLAPLKALSRASEDISKGVFNVEVPVRSGDEIGILSHTFNSMARDILKRTNLLRESEERLRAIIDNSTAVIYMKGVDGRYILVNRSFEEIMGRVREDVCGRTDYELFQSKIAETFRGNDLEVLTSASPKEFIEEIMLEDGEHSYISVKVPLLDNEGRPFALCGISTDITERRRMEEAVIKSEEKYRSLISNIPDVVWTCNEEGAVTFVSPNIEDKLGYQPEEVYSNPNIWFETVHPVDLERIKNAYAALFMEGKPFLQEYRIRKKDGEWIWVFDRSTGTYEKDGARYADGVMSDITGRKHAEEKVAGLTRLYAVLSRINEAIVRIRDTRKLYEESCRILVEDGKFGLAWVGLVNGETGYVEPVCHYGEGAYLEGIRVSCRDVPEGNGPTGRAVREGRYAITNDIRHEGEMKPWAERADRHNFRSSGAFPVFLYGRPIGAISIYATESDYFDREEIDLINSLAADISFAVESIEAERQIKRTDEELKLVLTLSLAIKEAEDFNSALRVAIEKICETTGWRFGEVWAPTQDGMRLEFLTAWYGKSAGLEKFIGASMKVGFASGEGLPGRVWATGEPEWLKDLSVNGKVFYRSELAIEAGLKAGFAIPVSALGKVLAVIIFYMAENREQDKRLVDLVSAITAQLGSILGRKLSEEARAEMQEKYEELVNNISVGIFRNTGKPDGCFTEANQALVAMMDAKDRDELLGHRNIEFFADRQRGMELLRTLQKTGVLQSEEAELITLRGRRFWGLINAVRKTDSNGNTVYDGILEDITERKRLEDQLRHSQKMEAVGQLAGGIAHDFNNILTAVIGYANLLLMKKGSDALVKGHAEHIISLSDKASKLTQGLLAFSRKQVMNPQPTDLNDLVKRIEKILARLIGEDVELRVTVGRTPLIVKADSTLIEQVLMNLSTNARDAMPRGGVLSISTDVFELGREYSEAHGYGDPGMYARILFSDTGVGMDAETVKKIFEPFFTTKDVGKGTGLGLSMVYGIIKQHNGFIDVYSEPGKGSTFKIYLPMVKEKATGINVSAETEISGGKETLLLAEDEADVREISQSMLEEFGYRVIAASDGVDAVEKFKANSDSVDLVIMDLVMPRKNGKEAYEEIKAIMPDVKCLFMSGYAPDTMKARGLEAGADLLTKPASPREFLKKIREVLER